MPQVSIPPVRRLLVALPFLLGLASPWGCIFQIEYVVPDHENAGNPIALRDPGGTQPLPDGLTVRFSGRPSPAILVQSPEEIIAEVPGGMAGTVPVSVWYGDNLASNIAYFRVDTDPLVYRILAFGDSLVGPWSFHPQKLDALLNDGLAPSLVINEGKAGERLAEGAARLESVISIHPGVAYLYILEGANDVSDGQDTPLQDMLASLDQMVQVASAQNIHPILLTLPPRTGQALSQDQTSPTTEEWNDAIRSYSTENGIDLVEIYDAFVAEPDWERFLDSSGLHLSQEGQAFVAQVLYDAFLGILP